MGVSLLILHFGFNPQRQPIQVCLSGVHNVFSKVILLKGVDGCSHFNSVNFLEKF